MTYGNTINLPNVVDRTGFASVNATAQEPGITGGFDYRYQRLSLGLKSGWESKAPWSSATRFRPEVNESDDNVDLRLSRKLTPFVQARNHFNKSYVVVVGDVTLRKGDSDGSNWVVDLKGES